MSKRSVAYGGMTLAAVLIALMSAGGSVVARGFQASQPQQQIVSERALLDQYCVRCHNDRLKSGAVALDKADLTKVAEDGELWEKVVHELRGGLMPPLGNPRPDAAAYDSFASALEKTLDSAALAKPNPGRTEAMHRLNRTEYQNVIRDLLAIDLDVAATLPPDDAGYGFDNIAGALKISQPLMERYLATSRKVSREAVGQAPAAPIADTFPIPMYKRQYDREEGLPFGTRGGTLIKYNFPRDAVYGIRVWFWCNQTSASCDPTSGWADKHELEVAIDGERVHVFTLEPKAENDRSYSTAKDDPTTWEVKVPVKGGVRDVVVAFIKPPSYEPSDGMRARWLRPSYEGNMVGAGLGVYEPHLSSVTISGPFEASGGPRDTPSRRRIFVCNPAKLADEPACARTIITALAHRAYRRPVVDSDVAPLLEFFKQGRAEAGTFDGGIEMALRAILVSPEFLFRVEWLPTSASVAKPGVRAVAFAGAPSDNYRLPDLELASRLSFFLWSSIPDDELLNVAGQNKLSDPAMLERQVRRMLADKRANALSRNFAPQWLELRQLEVASPSETIFPNFDESLRASFQQETELFIESIIREDRSALDLLNGKYTFVNERLAEHYGIANVRGSQFRRVTLADDSARLGLLGKGSMLTATSQGIRTSPVKRGKWILSNILGAPPSPPPPNVPKLEEKQQPGKALSIRERMAVHRANPVCASCHATIDPAGFALENFDATGAWRENDEFGKPIDTSGTLPDGTTFQSLAQFRAALLSRPDRFVTTLTQKLMIYALGRGLEYYDMAAVRTVTRSAAAKNYRFSTLILGIVESVPFQMRKGGAASEGTVAALGR